MAEKTKNLKPSTLIDIGIILLVVALLFGRTLTSYFLADDFGEVHYIHRIFNGQPWLLFSNFTGNYMQIPGMSVYRPFLLLSLLFDYIFWKGNAFGYYASNIFYYAADCILLYFIVKRLAPSPESLRNRLTSFFSSLFFALSALHCESVSWVVGRVDTACGFFYLLSILCILKSLTGDRKTLTISAIALFISALFIKEMAIGIPVVAFLIGLFYLKEDGNNFELKRKFKGAFIFSLPYLAATCVYFSLRYLTLGTLVGGYVAGFGASQEQNLLARWLDVDTMRRIAYPLVNGHFAGAAQIANILTIFYVATTTLFAVRLFSGQIPFRFTAFLIGWSLTTLVPIYKLWGLGYHLEGARFLFFFTMPLSCILASMLFQSKEKEIKSTYYSGPRLVAWAVAILFAGISAYICQKTNLIWIHAGKQVEAVNAQSIKILNEQANRQTVFLGIPKESEGTHMLLNGDTFRTMLNPPFNKKEVKSTFSTFEPIMYSPTPEIDTNRLQKLVSNGASVYVWSDETHFVPVKFISAQSPSSPSSKQFEPEELQRQGSEITINNQSINPITTDFLTINLEAQEPADGAYVGVSWGSPNFPLKKDMTAEPMLKVKLKSDKTNSQKLIHIPLSRDWRWFRDGEVNNFNIILPAAQKLKLNSIEISDQAKISPTIDLTQLTCSENGVYPLKATETNLAADAGQIPGATGLLIEITKPNFFFENFRESNGEDAVGSRFPVKNTKTNFALKRILFRGKGYYQVRVRAVNDQGETVGEPSCRLSLQVE